jgi:hypothetical protein
MGNFLYGAKKSCYIQLPNLKAVIVIDRNSERERGRERKYS